MRIAYALLTIVALAGCDTRKFTVNTTSKVLVLAQPGLQQEADYELARQAIPGSLKTVEGFWMVDPENPRLIKLLTEGYCSYGTAFVEDDWEAAQFREDLEAIEYHNTRSSKIFTRCLNYALKALGSRWQKEIFADLDTVKKLLAATSSERRFEMMYAGVSLGSLINHNLSSPEMLSYLPTVQAILEHVVALDEKSGPPANRMHAALPIVALGMLHSGRPTAMGGEPDKARAMFEKALALTDNKMLLARTLMAYRVGKQTNDRAFFHEQLKQVIETAPSVWPEQRLANEVAHRKARRYLKHEKELFQ